MGITIEDESLAVSIALENGREIQNDIDRMTAKNQSLVVCFVHSINAQHKGYLHHLRNSYLDGVDNYPSTVQEAHNILCHQDEDNPHQIQDNDGVSFAQHGQQQ